jgi:hypothetical protein
MAQNNAVVGLQIDASQAQAQVRAIAIALGEALGPKTLERFNKAYDKTMKDVQKQTKDTVKTVKNDFGSIDFKGVLLGNRDSIRNAFGELGKAGGGSFLSTFSAVLLGQSRRVQETLKKVLGIKPTGVISSLVDKLGGSIAKDTRTETNIYDSFMDPNASIRTKIKSRAAMALLGLKYGKLKVPEYNVADTARFDSADEYERVLNASRAFALRANKYVLPEGLRKGIMGAGAGAASLASSISASIGPLLVAFGAVAVAVGAVVLAFRSLFGVIIETYNQFKIFNKQREILRSTARNIGGVSTAALESQAGFISRGTGLAKADIFGAQGDFLRAGFGQQRAGRLTQIAANIAAEQGENIGQVVQVLIAAFATGQVEGLKKYGIVGKNIGAVQASLERNYSAANPAITDRSLVLQERIKDFYLSIGEKVTPAVNKLLDSLIRITENVPAATIDSLGNSLASLAESFGRLMPALNLLVRGMAGAAALSAMLTDLAVKISPSSFILGQLGGPLAPAPAGPAPNFGSGSLSIAPPKDEARTRKYMAPVRGDTSIYIIDKQERKFGGGRNTW